MAVRRPGSMDTVGAEAGRAMPEPIYGGGSLFPHPLTIHRFSGMLAASKPQALPGSLSGSNKDLVFQ